jgi:hypothetical protein
MSLPDTPPLLNDEDGCGDFSHGQHWVELTIDHPLGPEHVLTTIYENLKNFHCFNGGENETAMIAPVTSRGVLYMVFEPFKLFGYLTDIVNGEWVPVRVWSRRATTCVTADTAGRHMLVGQRRWWCVHKGNTYVIRTESYDRARGIWNWLGFMGVGKDRQYEIWIEYLENLAFELTFELGGHGAEVQRLDVEVIDEQTGRPPEWQAVERYPGKEIP